MPDKVLPGSRHIKFCSDWFRGFYSTNTWFCRAFWVISFSFIFGFFNKATAYTLERIFTQNTSKDVVPRTDMPFLGSRWLCLTFRPWYFRKIENFGTHIEWRFFAAKNRFNIGMLQYKLPLIVIIIIIIIIINASREFPLMSNAPILSPIKGV